MAQVLQTRFVGFTRHASGEVMAPQDLVYEVEEPKRPDRSRLFSEEWSAPNPWVSAVLAIYSVCGLSFIAWHVLTN